MTLLFHHGGKYHPAWSRARQNNTYPLLHSMCPLHQEIRTQVLSMCSGRLRMVNVLVCFLLGDKHHDQQQPERKEGFPSFCASRNRLSWREVKAGAPGKNLDQRPQEDTSHWLISRHESSCLSYTARAHLPRDATTHSGPGPPTSISNHENAPHPHECPQVNLMETTLQLRFPLPRWLVCVNLKIKAGQRSELLEHVCRPGTEQPWLKLPHLRKQTHLSKFFSSYSLISFGPRQTSCFTFINSTD